MQDFKFRPFLTNQLMRPVTTGRIVHAQIFAGPEGTGKHSAAVYVSQALNCTASGQRPCGVCPSCLRFRDGNAPDLIEVRREPDKSVIPVDAIRDMIGKVSLSPEGRCKCVIINEAERMAAPAQNALLKTLEDAPEYAVFYLLTRAYTSLLPTIRSRCQLLRFPPLSLRETEQALIDAGIDASVAHKAAPLSFGSIGKALAISRDSAYLSDVDELEVLFKRFKSVSDIPFVAPEFSKFKKHPQRMLEILEESAEELMLDKAVNPVAVALKKNGHDGSRLMHAVIACLKKLDSHVTYQYAAEMLLYDMTRISNV